MKTESDYWFADKVSRLSGDDAMKTDAGIKKISRGNRGIRIKKGKKEKRKKGKYNFKKRKFCYRERFYGMLFWITNHFYYTFSTAIATCYSHYATCNKASLCAINNLL